MAVMSSATQDEQKPAPLEVDLPITKPEEPVADSLPATNGDSITNGHEEPALDSVLAAPAPESAPEPLPEPVPETKPLDLGLPTEALAPVSDSAQPVEPIISDVRDEPLPEPVKEEPLPSGIEEPEPSPVVGEEPAPELPVEKVDAQLEADVMDTTEDAAPRDLPLHPHTDGATEEAKPALGGELVSSPKDTEMADIPPSPSKLSRSRDEEDEEDGPSSKRSKVEEEQPPVAAPPTATLVKTVVENSDAPLTKPQSKYLLAAIRSLKRTKDARFFKSPVDHVALNIPNYPNIIKNPMDLGTMEEKLKNETYTTLAEYLQDFDFIVNNSTTFNGPQHPVTQSAFLLKGAFEKQLGSLPKPDAVEPTAAEKKAQRAAAVEANKTSAGRREPRVVNSTAPPPPAVTSPTFALGPTGVPQIRRDSTVVGDGRPKREIHPPKPRDLPYTGVKPRKKKYAAELKFCDEAMKEIMKPKYSYMASVFYEPVDPVALNIPHYHKVIKKPMDFHTISDKLKGNEYENAGEFETDVRLVFQNCYKFNPPKDPVYNAGKQMEEIFDNFWANKKAYLAKHQPSGSRSPDSSDAEDDSEEEESSEDDEDDAAVSLLEKQLAEMSRNLANLKKKAKDGTKKKKRKSDSAAPASKKRKNSDFGSSYKKEKKKSKKDKAPYVDFEQKKEISERINTLPPVKMAQALRIIRDNLPDLPDEEELELDIDDLPPNVLYKLYQFVQKHAPRPDDPVSSPPPVRTKGAAKGGVPKQKKNKPMSKSEQEARIAELQSQISNYDKVDHGDVLSGQEEDGSSEEEEDEESGSESEEE